MTIRTVRSGDSVLNTERTFSRADTSTHAAGSGAFSLTIAPMPLMGAILALQAVPETALTGDASNYWTATLQRARTTSGGVTTAVAMASKLIQSATLNNGGENMVALLPWTFDAVTFTAANAACNKDDVIRVLWTPTGSPGALPALTYMVRYQGT